VSDYERLVEALAENAELTEIVADLATHYEAYQRSPDYEPSFRTLLPIMRRAHEAVRT
jgi:hypothetical protein